MGTWVAFQVLAIINSAAMNIGVHVSSWIRVFFFSGYIPRSGIAGSYGSPLLIFFKGTSMFFSIVAAPIYISTNSVRGFPFLHTLSSI